MDQKSLLFSESHEWIRCEGKTCAVGISKFAVDQLTDIVYVELPAVGKVVAAGGTFGVIESVKAVSDLYSPVAGKVVAVNQAVADDPSILSQDPYDKGWLIRIERDGELEASTLMDKARYDEFCAHSAH